jgi:endoglucanase
MPNPFQTATLPTNPNSRAAQYLRANPTDPNAAAIEYIATQPQAVWLETPNPTPIIQQILTPLTPTQLPVFVLYNIPHRDNNGASSRGAPNLTAYTQYIDAVTSACTLPSVFILEPDALAQIPSLDPDYLEERNQCLAYAITQLSPTHHIYVDMGHDAWLPPETILPLYQALATTANRGFSINVSNFRTDAANALFAQALYEATAKPSITDTSRNGNGPAPDGSWCNPPNRRIGQLPLAIPPTESLDANLWIKHPGESDGPCHNAPPAGQFSPTLAAALVDN